MGKVNIDKNIEEVLNRGVENIYPDKESLEKVLLGGKKIRLYCGFDPSAPSLQLGNAVAISKLAQWQALGHEVIFLVGDFTGMIGDPDKLSVRKKMTRQEVLTNAKLYKEQAGKYLKFSGANAAKLMYNSKWSDPMTFKDLIEISSNFTVQQMIQRDMFQRRLKEEKPIYLHEFLYPLAQGYDSVAMDVDLEVGGNDQMFNMMAGRHLQKVINKKEKFVMTLKTFEDDKGTKMGKSEGNAVFMDEAPENMYGVIMSWPDGFIAPAFELITTLSWEEAKELIKQTKDKKVNPRDLKMRVAREIITLIYDEKVAKNAEKQFIKTFRKKQTPDEVESRIVDRVSWIAVDLFTAVGLVSSKGEARRLIEQKGLKVNDKLIKTADEEIKISAKGLILQRGKRQFIKVVKK